MLVCQKNKLFSVLDNISDSQFLHLLIADKDKTLSLSGEDCLQFEKCTISDNQIFLDFNLTSLFNEEKKDVFEIKLYIEKSEHLKILINKLPANTFQLDEAVEFYFFDRKLQLEFNLIEGEGSFWGHAFFSNRPSRLVNDQFQSFDWMVGLRTIKRALNCRVRAKLSIF